MFVKNVGILISHGIEKYGAGVLGVDTALNLGCCATALYSAGKFIQAARNGNMKKACLWGAVGGSAAVLGAMNVYNTWKEIFESATRFSPALAVKEFWDPTRHTCYKTCNLFRCEVSVINSLHPEYSLSWDPKCGDLQDYLNPSFKP